MPDSTTQADGSITITCAESQQALQGPALGCSLAEVQAPQPHADGNEEQLILASTGKSDLVRPAACRG